MVSISGHEYVNFRKWNVNLFHRNTICASRELPTIRMSDQQPTQSDSKSFAIKWRSAASVAHRRR